MCENWGFRKLAAHIREVGAENYLAQQLSE